VPLVTVLMPAWNREGFVREAVDSVLAQTFADFELLVVDDGSTDATAAAVAAVSDPRVRCLREPHRGIGGTMNAGLRAACGRYVARLDSDDVWLPEFLATQVPILEARPGVGVAYARAQGMEADGTLTAHVWGMAPRYPDDHLRSMLWGDFTCNITTVVRRELLEHVGGFDESLIAGEDWDLWLRVARETRFAFTDRVLARFRWHAGNLTGSESTLGARILAERTRVLDKFFATPDLPPGLATLRAVAYRNVLVGTGLLRLGRRDYAAAMRDFGRALTCGANPLTTFGRIGWFVLDWHYLSRRPWGRRLIDWQSAVRRRVRAKRLLRQDAR
jgi:glycosyltransferase involved in cell wall biosynthesis